MALWPLRRPKPSPHTRQRAESRATQADSEIRQKGTPFVLATPEAIRAAQAPRLRNLDGLRSPAEMEAHMRRALENPGEQHRIAAGAPLMCHGKPEWITLSPAVWFNTLFLRRQCPSIQSLLEPVIRTIPKSASLQVPFCLQCRDCFGVGVYDAKSIAYCLECLPMILGYAAASRFIHCVLDFHRSLAETHQALRVKPPLSPRGLRICDQILALAPHPLPYLVTSAIRPPGSLDLAARHKDFIRGDIQVFLCSCEVLSNYISQSNPLCQQEAALRGGYLQDSLRLDVELLMGHLVTFSTEATELSHANTLHALPAHPQSEMQIENGQVDSFLGQLIPHNLFTLALHRLSEWQHHLATCAWGCWTPEVMTAFHLSGPPIHSLQAGLCYHRAQPCRLAPLPRHRRLRRRRLYHESLQGALSRC